MNGRLTLCLLLFSFLSLQCLADEPRYRSRFRSRNGVYELRVTRQTVGKVKRKERMGFDVVTSTEWGLFDLVKGTKLYSLTGAFTSKTVGVSNDGRSLAVVDDYSEEDPTAGHTALEFYRDGQLLRAYTLGELLCSPENVSQSASHFSWFPKWGLDYGLTSEFREDFRTLTLTTYELRTLTFDARTGKILSDRMDPAVNAESVQVYGEVRRLGEDSYQVEVCHRVFRRVPEDGKIRFTSRTKLLGNRLEYMTLLLNRGQYTQTSHGHRDWILNQCNFKHEKKIGEKARSDRYRN